MVDPSNLTDPPVPGNVESAAPYKKCDEMWQPHFCLM